jgi:hypothetical protein
VRFSSAIPGTDARPAATHSESRSESDAGAEVPNRSKDLLIGLSGDADIKTRKPMQTGVVNGWRCRYDLQTGKFDVPPLFSNDNAKAVLPQ